MLTVTSAAGRHLAALLEKTDGAANLAIRILQRARKYTLHLDQAGPGDETFSHDGRLVLIIDDVVFQSLKEKVLDLKTTPEGSMLSLQ